MKNLQRLSKIDPIRLSVEAERMRARYRLWDYCRLMHPTFYKKDRLFLMDLCDSIQSFLMNEHERFLVINMPPRHGKSFTATNTAAWLLGNNPRLKVMTISYNEILSTTFAKQVRDTIDTIKVSSRIVYNDIFPHTKIKKGDSSASLWSLVGSPEKNYLASSPTSTITGFGGNVVIIDDLLKNCEEAYNDRVLEKHWEFFANTLIQRKEGNNWKFIIIMTRWATQDLAGQVLAKYDDIRHIKYKALQDDNTMLCDEILNLKDYYLTIQEMNIDIVEANYQQEPIDIKGKLYGEFKTWDSLPLASVVDRYNQTDTADTGSDYLCSINYIVYNKDVYITEIIYTQDSMEYTEQNVADILKKGNIHEAVIESNNGGRGFARSVKRILQETYGHYTTSIKTETQTRNKESRILTASGWVSNHIYMPFNWKQKYPEFYKEVSSYQKKGKNAHDDACDCLSSIFEKVTSECTPIVLSKKQIGVW